jgi:predicted nuclease of restriction endonuclease-like (RecB) superfamily
LGSKEQKFDFEALVSAICAAHEQMATQAAKAVNVALTLRNWAIGCYIREYELHGADRATYGERVLARLAGELQNSVDRCYTGRYLRLCRQFYETYPQIGKSVISEFGVTTKGKSLISRLPALPAGIAATRKADTKAKFVSPETLVENLSFTHIVELLKLNDSLQRAFYEIESIRGNWSVRELKRQIGSLYYERSGLSGDKDKLAKLANAHAEQVDPRLAIRDWYVLEFLGIKPKEAMKERDLEEALLDKLQEFLLELGFGFCFEERQKRILIGDEHYFIDLVFYHRILKCHVLVELKVEPFTHENLGQLNTYVNWYRENIMAESDNPPIGLLLCTQKDHALAKYALAGIANQLFVSRYQLQLPRREEIEAFVEKQVQEITGTGHIIVAPAQVRGTGVVTPKKAGQEDETE